VQLVTARLPLAIRNFSKRVIAIDISPQQSAHSFQQSGIEYKIASAENTRLKDNSIDLLTVAQAVHWFDFRNFHKAGKFID
jgi:ubiquinone/menaquinone biosynthesis C-methylase UbiE